MKIPKLLTAIAIAAAMLSFAGCGEKNDSNTSVDDTPEDSISAPAETTEAETEAIPETEPPTEPPTEAPTEAEPEMTFAELEDIADMILSGNTDTIDDMVASLAEWGFEFDKEQEYVFDGPEFSIVANVLETPINFSGFDESDIVGISVCKHYTDYPDDVSFTFNTPDYDSDDYFMFLAAYNDFGERFYNFLLDQGCQEREDGDLTDDRFSKITKMTTIEGDTNERVVRVYFEK